MRGKWNVIIGHDLAQSDVWWAVSAESCNKFVEARMLMCIHCDEHEDEVPPIDNFINKTICCTTTLMQRMTGI